MTVAFPSSSMIGAFLLTCLLRGMTYDTGVIVIKHWFLLTCLLRGMTGTQASVSAIQEFLLTCLLRGMTVYLSLSLSDIVFLLTCLLRGMTLADLGALAVDECFYSHASCEAWRHMCPKPKRFTVSTHMPLARHDPFSLSCPRVQLSFYSHASCEAWPG